MEGLKLGEAQAFALLGGYSRTYTERFDGYTLTRLDGRSIRIVGGEVTDVYSSWILWMLWKRLRAPQ